MYKSSCAAVAPLELPALPPNQSSAHYLVGELLKFAFFSQCKILSFLVSQIAGIVRLPAVAEYSIRY